MGRHQLGRERRVGRLVVSAGVVGAGAVSAGVLPAAWPVTAAPTAWAADSDSTADDAGDSSDAASPPCTETAIACVSISRKTAWLTDGNGDVLREVPISTGARGYETPRGTFHVTWKDRHHVSQERDRAPMPWSVFFAPGLAFHGGSLRQQSAGCVHLDAEDARAFFTNMQVDDEVQIVS